eukprot:jgi/Chlat1/7173/Chrsp57S06838
MGLETHVVPMSMHAEHRAKLRKALLEAIHAQDNGSQGSAVVLLQGGQQLTRHETDHEPLFRQESFFAYLFGVSEADFYGVLDLTTGRTFLFIPRLPSQYAVWMGAIHPTTFFQEKYAVDAVHYVDELATVLQQLSSGSSTATVLYRLHGKNSDSGLFAQPASFDGIDLFATDDSLLYPVLAECRVKKTAEEIQVMRYVCRISSEAHVSVMRQIQPGMMQYQLESLFLHYIYTKGGCRHVSYTCICGTGASGAILHYGHAGAPNDRLVNDGDIALLDMGGEYHCYGADITCSYPVNGRFTADQKSVYEAVLAAQSAVIESLEPGVSWVDMHRLAERQILEHLLRAGFLKGSIEELVSKHIGAVFMPHGLGHLLGIDTHDVGGYPAGTERIDEPGIRHLRTVRKLEEGMIITVEPGCYFIHALLEPAMSNPETAHLFVEKAIRRCWDFGGVRLEDDVLIRADGCENLTKCPRTVADLEAVMAGATWNCM